MSAKHLKKGDALPPFTGKLRVYNMRFCPYAERTILALNAKKVPYEVVNIDLVEKPEWLTTKSPLGKVPALEVDDGVTISESLIIAEYIDEKYPERPLSSKDPLRKAQDKLIIEHFTSVTSSQYKLVHSDSTDDSVKKTYYAGLENVESVLKKRATKFLFGDQPGYVDYMIWPWFERLELAGDEQGLSEDTYPLLVAWVENMKEDPAVKEYLIPTKMYKKFYESRMGGGHPNFDLLLDSN